MNTHRTIEKKEFLVYEVSNEAYRRVLRAGFQHIGKNQKYVAQPMDGKWWYRFCAALRQLKDLSPEDFSDPVCKEQFEGLITATETALNLQEIPEFSEIPLKNYTEAPNIYVDYDTHCTLANALHDLVTQVAELVGLEHGMQAVWYPHDGNWKDYWTE
jgi:hypothetical protein